MTDLDVMIDELDKNDEKYGFTRTVDGLFVIRQKKKQFVYSETGKFLRVLND